MALTTLSHDGIRVWHPPGSRERQYRQSRSEKLSTDPESFPERQDYLWSLLIGSAGTEGGCG